MALNKISFKRISTLFLLLLLFLIHLGALGTKKHENGQTESGPDGIVIEALKRFGPLERPAVLFKHDRHTDALEKENQTCDTCHIPRLDNKTSLSMKFFRNKDTSKDDLMTLYHNQCIGCHRQKANKYKNTGPIEICGECHRKRSAIISKKAAAGFDKYRHFQHVSNLKGSESEEKTCQLCHHEYDEITQVLFYEKNKEGTCRYCHKEQTEENRVSMRIASHIACIDCHREKGAQNLKTGHITCGKCHKTETKPSTAPVRDIPRLDRAQPEFTLITFEINVKQGQQRSMRMDPVPFDHKAHEDYNETCRVCHHASLDSCTKSCHTLTGSKEGGYIALEQAMHQSEKKASCIGCHEINQRDPNCAACHVSGKANRNLDKSCISCHMKPLTESDQENRTADKVITAKSLLDSRKLNRIPEDEKIQETVVINQLSDKYEPVELPHRRIVHALFDGIKHNRLAGYFHQSSETICQGCHHNSPATLNPPRCSSCHGKPFREENVSRPGLKGAYHQMCMGCHDVMGLEKPRSTECVECHKLKR